MRRTSIEEVGQLLEHVLLMPAKPLRILIINFPCVCGHHLSSYYIGCYPIVARPLISLPPYLSRCFMTIEDDYILFLKSVSGVVRFSYSYSE